MTTKHVTGLITGLIFFLTIILFVELDSSKPEITKMAAVAVLMATLWITEAIPLAATALVPLILFPLLSLLPGEEIAGAYINSVIFLFLGGFLIAIAMETWGLHKRIALKIISVFGGTPNSIIIGFMLAAAFLSMWISNTATAVMMLPIALSIIIKLEDQFGKEKTSNFSKSLLLSIAYACSLGGLSTLIGTPPNLALVRIYKIIYPGAPEISFGSWMILSIPIALLMLGFSAVLIIKIFFKVDKSLRIEKEFIAEEYKKLGPPSFQEKAIGVIFISTALLWIFRTDLNFGFLLIRGWSSLFSVPYYIDDGTIAVTMAFILFLIPSKDKKNKRTILDFNSFEKVPWSIILLFGGGFALASGFSNSGLSSYIGSHLSSFSHLSPVLIILFAAFIMNFLTELTSNTATTQMILPILAAVSAAIGIHPLLLMITATLSASMAFMLPVATPPNTIIFASRRIKVFDMVKAGFTLNIVGVIVVTVLVYLLGSYIFDLSVFPDWAK
ncbi:MAG: SLC13/DASS family transporter [Ignavibacterium sp.]|nr:SLC13/DASS family transporter [Ignavibacterium sp.]